MTDIITQARLRLLATKLWGRVPHRAIEGGHWDAGCLVQEQVNAILRERREAEGE